MKRVLRMTATVMLACLLLLSGCDKFKQNEKEFSKAGLTITLTEAFVEQDHVQFTSTYASANIVVYVLKEEFSILNTTNINLYKSMIKQNNANKNMSDFEEKNGLLYATFEMEYAASKYNYIVTIFKGSDAFWLVQFACKSDKYEKLKDDIFKYAETIKVE